MSGNLISAFFTTALLIALYTVESSTHHISNDGEFFIKIPTLLCKIIGYALYFSGVSMFVWTTLLSYDLASSMNELKIPEEKSKMVFTERFLKYTIVGVGAPLCMTLGTFAMDQLELNENVPGVGADCCFLTFSGIYYRTMGYTHKTILQVISVLLSFACKN